MSIVEEAGADSEWRDLRLASRASTFLPVDPAMATVGRYSDIVTGIPFQMGRMLLYVVVVVVFESTYARELCPSFSHSTLDHDDVINRCHVQTY